jgi:nucleoid-associated protein YgaU
VAYSNSLTIEELGQDGSPIRVLALKGPGMPKVGANWGGESVVPTTWYVGNPDEATQQVLVSKELPTKWEGTWRLTMLNRTPCSLSDPSGLAGLGPQEAEDVTSPGLLADTMDDMRRKGRLLRVTWTVASDTPGVARTILRLGRMTHFDAKYMLATDVDWECEWSWKSRGASQARVTSTRDDNVPSAATALSNAAQGAVVAAQSAIQASNPNVANSANRFTLGQLEQLAEAPVEFVDSIVASLNQAVEQFAQIAQLLVTVMAVPFQIANSAINFARNTVDLGNQFSDDLNRTPFEQCCTSDDVADLARSFRYFGQVDDAVLATNAQGEILQQQFRPTLSTNPGAGQVSSRSLGGSQERDFVAVRITKAGDTPVSLSVLYYGTPDRDVDILKANRLPWYQISFDPGSIVVIPVLQATNGLTS